MSDESLREFFPEIEWSEPVSVEVPGHARRWVCRYCIAQRGLKAAEITMTPFAFTQRSDALNHIKRKHS